MQQFVCGFMIVRNHSQGPRLLCLSNLFSFHFFSSHILCHRSFSCHILLIKHFFSICCHKKITIFIASLIFFVTKLVSSCTMEPFIILNKCSNEQVLRLNNFILFENQTAANLQCQSQLDSLPVYNS